MRGDVGTAARSRAVLSARTATRTGRERVIRRYRIREAAGRIVAGGVGGVRRGSPGPGTP